MIGHSELLLIALLVLVLFSANRFPQLMENFAKGIKSYKKTMHEDDEKSQSRHTTKATKSKASVAKKSANKSSTKKK